MDNKELIINVTELALEINIKKQQEPHKNLAYISGKVTGLNPDYVKDKFLKSESQLIANGFNTFNPTRVINPNCDWQQAMKLCLAILPLCDVIVMQPDYTQSEGAKWELAIAERLGLKIIIE